MRAYVLVLLAACHATSPRPADLATRAAPGLKALDSAQLEKDTRYLASDELEGRAPGTPGGMKAEDYVARRYAEIGLQPAGEHGTYFQTVPLREASLISGSFVAHTTRGDVALEPGDDIVLKAWTRAPEVAIDAPVVFVGYGLDRPDLGFDDLAGVNVRGSIAVIFAGAPRSVGGKRLDDSLHAVLSETADRSRRLRDRGAVAILAVFDPVREKQIDWPHVVSAQPTSAMDWLDGGEVASGHAVPLRRHCRRHQHRRRRPAPGAVRRHGSRR